MSQVQQQEFAPTLGAAVELTCGHDNGKQRCDRYPHTDRVHSAVLARYVGGAWDGRPSASVSWGEPVLRSTDG